jgi:hypothetical protein
LEAPALDELFEAEPGGRFVFDNQDAFGDRSGFARVNSDFARSCDGHSNHLNHVIFTFWSPSPADASSTIK